jgi:hypothetical protein
VLSQNKNKLSSKNGVSNCLEKMYFPWVARVSMFVLSIVIHALSGHRPAKQDHPRHSRTRKRPRWESQPFCLSLDRARGGIQTPAQAMLFDKTKGLWQECKSFGGFPSGRGAPAWNHLKDMLVLMNWIVYDSRKKFDLIGCLVICSVD